MILLDTDHLTVLMYPESEQHDHLMERMRTSTDSDFATTIINAEEMLRGWLAEINRRPAPRQQIPAYERLLKLLVFLRPFKLIGFDESAAVEFDRLRKTKVRIGSMDLKIASIALVHDTLLLSANLRDFQQVPSLRVENWLQE